MKHSYILVFLLIGCLRIFAFDLTSFEKITSSSGLSHNSVFDIEQDADGFMWFATRDGLNKYDGFSMKVYYPMSGGVCKTDYVQNVEANDFNDIFVTVDNELFRLDKSAQKFIPITDTSTAFKTLYNIKIFNNSIYLCTNNGLYRSDYPYINIKHIVEWPLNIYSIEALLDGTFLISSLPGLTKIDSTGKTLKRVRDFIESQPRLIRGKHIAELAEDKDSNVWLGSYNSGLYRYDHKKNLIEKVEYPKNIIAPREIIRSLEVFNSQLFIGTENGLIIYDIDNDSWSQINKTIPARPESINDNAIYSTFIGKTGILWIGTYFGGVNYSNIKEKAFKSINPCDKPGCLTGKVVRQMLEDKDGNIYIATEDAGLFFYNTTTKKFTNYNVSNSNIGSDNIHSLCFDHKGSLWVGTIMGGLNRFNLSTHTFKCYLKIPNDENSLVNSSVFDVTQDKELNLWVGTPNGMCRYDYQNDNFVIDKELDLKDHFVYSIYNDSKGNVWFVTKYKGLICYNPKEKTIKHYTYETYNILHQLCCVYEDKNGIMWFGSMDNGLIRLNTETDSIKVFNNKNYLTSNSVNAISDDNSGNLWISTNNGITSLNLKTYKTKHYNVNHGLVSNQFNYTSCLKTKNGELYFGSINGISYFNPDSISQAGNSVNLHITDFKLFNKSPELFDPNLTLENINKTKQIVLKEKWNVITIEYAAIDYSLSKENKYAYFLEGFDKDWNYVNEKRDVTYTNLNSGKYTFYLKGTDGLNNWSQQKEMFTIIIEPPFYKTPFFITIITFLALLIIVGGNSLRIYRIKKHSRELETLVQKRTKEISDKNNELELKTNELFESNKLLKLNQLKVEEQAHELERQRDELLRMNATKDKLFSIIAHDIKTPFNSIIGFSELFSNEIERLTPDEIKNYSGIIHETAMQLFDLLTGLLDWARAQMGHIKMFPEQVNIHSLVNGIFMIVEPAAHKKQNNLVNNIDSELTIFADKNIISTVIRNLVNNAIKFTDKGQIEVTLQLKSKGVEICVSDTGVGMENDTIKQLFNIEKSKSTVGTAGEKGTGLGLIVCAELMQIHKSELMVKSEPNKGSTFCFFITTDIIQ